MDRLYEPLDGWRCAVCPLSPFAATTTKVYVTDRQTDTSLYVRSTSTRYQPVTGFCELLIAAPSKPACMRHGTVFAPSLSYSVLHYYLEIEIFTSNVRMLGAQKSLFSEYCTSTSYIIMEVG